MEQRRACRQRRRSQLFLASLILLTLLGVSGDRGESVAGPGGGPPQKTTAEMLAAPHVPGRLLVKFKPGTDRVLAESIHLLAGASEKKRFRRDSNLRLVTVPSGTDLGIALDAYRSQPEVLHAEPDYIRYAYVQPNDPRFDEQWGLNNTGQSGGLFDFDIDGPEAWEDQQRSPAVIIASIDSGIDLGHPDLPPPWTNPGEIPGNDIDDDENGLVDDVNGWDFINNDSDPSDDNGHGTLTMGVATALGNNGIGISGVTWSARIMALKHSDSDGRSSDSASIAAIDYAVEMGASVINNSWGGPEYSFFLEQAIERANAAGVLVVAAAGNSTRNIDLVPDYPASYTTENIISVAAVNRSGALSSFSNWGATGVDLAAPGEEILSTYPGGVYASVDGTSFAAPFVSGAAALILGGNGRLSHLEVKQIVLDSVEPAPSLTGLTATGGVLDLQGALDLTPPPPDTGTPGGTVCMDGPDSGRPCTFDEQCQDSCVADGSPCAFNTDCEGRCSLDDASCILDQDCTNHCSHNFAPCLSDQDCGEGSCSHNSAPCLFDEDCNSYCSDNGAPCLQDGDCDSNCSNNGAPCLFDEDCDRWCTHNGAPCHQDHDCSPMFCSNNGALCAIDEDCDRQCSNGAGSCNRDQDCGSRTCSNNGAPCLYDHNCGNRTCIGGYNHGQTCSGPQNCRGICNGGTSHGDSCSNNFGCPLGECIQVGQCGPQPTCLPRPTCGPQPECIDPECGPLPDCLDATCIDPTCQRPGACDVSTCLAGVCEANGCGLVGQHDPLGWHHAAANSIGGGLEPSNAIDVSHSSYCSSVTSSGSQNTGGEYVAAWLVSSQQPYDVNAIHLHARVDPQTGQALGFPARYNVYLSNTTNQNLWVLIGEFDLQPEGGEVEILLPTPQPTRGIRVEPVELGQDENGDYVFQIAEVELFGCRPETDEFLCTGLCEEHTVVDRCGNARTLDCGHQCQGGLECINDVCVCVPTTCQAQGAECGTIPDECGGELDCSSCPPGEICIDNECCDPKTCLELNVSCGYASDQCGGQIYCGSCTGGNNNGGSGFNIRPKIRQIFITSPNAPQTSTTTSLINNLGLTAGFLVDIEYFGSDAFVTTPAAGSLPGESTVDVELAIDATGLPEGTHVAVVTFTVDEETSMVFTLELEVEAFDIVVDR